MLTVLGSIHATDFTVPISDRFVNGIVEAGFGSPPTTYNLMVDSGLGNTFVGAEKSYVNTSITSVTGRVISFSSNETTLTFSGPEYKDVLTLGSFTVNPLFCVVSNINELTDVADGILGLGPTGLTEGTVVGDSKATIPTVTDDFNTEGSIATNSIIINNTTLTFGSSNSANAIFTPITKLSPASNYWGDRCRIQYSDTVLLNLTAGIIDHGSARILLATDAYYTFGNATGSTPDQQVGILRNTNCPNLQPLTLNIAGMSISIPVDNYRWPQQANTEIGGDSDACYLAVGDIGKSSGFDFILGWNTLKNYNVILDTANQRVGIAPYTK
ncbi:hypothetical protein BGZ46_005628 [Entomortierella lignicola]|nr:hypothetical protein BGZ46_005628 [Entomortierella lignicola]